MTGELLPFIDALKSAEIKTLLPTDLSSADLMKIASDIRERSRFSARTSNAEYVQFIDDTINRILNPAGGEGMNFGTGRAELKMALDKISYEPAPGKAGTIEDLGSDARLNLIIKTNVEMAEGYGGYVQGMDQDALDAYPAQELFRAEARIEPRDWPQRWEEAGGEFYPGLSDYPEGRMIALKTDPIWEAISAFGLPYPPFDFNSGMWIRDIDRKEAVELGLIKEIEELTPKQRDFNEDLKMTADIRDEGLRTALLDSVGSLFHFVGDVLVGNESLANEGEGRGNWGHAGRPGEIGGSAPSGEVPYHETQRSVTTDAAGKEKVTRTLPDGSPLPEWADKMRIPPAWTDVRIAKDPNGELLVQGKDAKGRVQSVYSESHWTRVAAEKFARTKELLEKHASISNQNSENLKSEDHDKRENASVMSLIMSTGIRPGSDKDTLAAKQAYGATTLQGRHVVIDGDNVRLEFTGKKGVDLKIPVEDEAVKKMLIERKSVKGDTGRLFDTDSQRLLEYSHRLDGGSFKTKDFRTLMGTKTAIEEVNKITEKPHSMIQFKKMVMGIAKKVSQKLGNTPTIALQSYIDPNVFASLRPI
jgi:DNA topoisomerase-1